VLALGTVKTNRRWYWLYLQRRNRRRRAAGANTIEPFASFRATAGAQKFDGVYSAADVGDIVRRWLDQSGNERHAVTAEINSTLSDTDEASVHVNANASQEGSLFRANGTLLFTRTVIARLRINGPPAFTGAFLRFGSTWALTVRDDGILGLHGEGASAFSATPTPEGFFVLAMTYNNGPSVLRINGVEILSADVGTELIETQGDSHADMVGGFTLSVEFSKVDFYERVLSLEEIEAAESEFADEAPIFAQGDGSQFTQGDGIIFK
jgi:hypothetical protein